MFAIFGSGGMSSLVDWRVGVALSMVRMEPNVGCNMVRTVRLSWWLLSLLVEFVHAE